MAASLLQPAIQPLPDQIDYALAISLQVVFYVQ